MHGLPLETAYHIGESRNQPYSGVRFLFTTFIALMFGTIFWDIGSKRLLIEIPYIFIQTLVYGVIVYAMIGFEWTASKFFWYLFFMFFTFYGMMAVGATRIRTLLL